MAHYKEIIDAFIEKNKTASLLIVLLFSVGSLVMDFSSQTTKEYIALMEQQKETIAKLEFKVESNDEELLVLRAELLNLKDLFYQLETGGSDLPIPHWIKSVGSKHKPGVMLYMNPAYETWYLEPSNLTRRDYLFKTDTEFWGEGLGAKYWEIDLEVIRTRETVYSSAPHPLHPSKMVGIVKWPYIKRGELYAIGGIVIPQPFDE